MTKISEYVNSHDLTKKALFDVSEDTSVAQDGTSYETKSLRKAALIADILSNVPAEISVSGIVLNPLDGSITIQQNNGQNVVMAAPALQNYIDGRITPLTSANGTGTAFALNNVAGTFYNMSSASSATTYTTTNLTLGCYACGLINTATEPTVTGGTKILGSDFIPNTNMHLWVQYFGVTVQYFFAEL